MADASRIKRSRDGSCEAGVPGAELEALAIEEAGDVRWDDPETPNGQFDALTLYPRDVQRRRRISADDTRRCCRAMRDADAAGANGHARKDNVLVFRAKRRETIEGNFALVVSIARRYRPFGLPMEDLIQEGNLGLLAAVRRFDPELGVNFSMYAAGWIRQAICRAISIKSRTIRIPLDVLGLRRRAARVMVELEQEAHNQSCRSGQYEAPTWEDCADELGISADGLRTTVQRVPNLVSLDAPAVPGGEPVGSSVADSGQRDPLECASADEQRSLLHAAVSALPRRLRRVMLRHCGLSDEGPASFSEIGRELHVSRERVCQLHNQGLALLRSGPRPRSSANLM